MRGGNGRQECVHTLTLLCGIRYSVGTDHSISCPVRSTVPPAAANQLISHRAPQPSGPHCAASRTVTNVTVRCVTLHDNRLSVCGCFDGIGKGTAILLFFNKGELCLKYEYLLSLEM